MAEQFNWEKKDSLEDVKIILAKVLSKWYWLMLGLLLGLAGAYLFNRYKAPEYELKASFISKKFQESSNSLVPALSDAGLFSTERIEIFQQIPLLKSEERILETLRRLDFEVTYVAEGRLISSELYKSSPFAVVTSDSAKNIPYDRPIYLENIKKGSYSLSSNNVEWNRHFQNKTFLFNQEQELNGWIFTIQKEGNNGMYDDYRYSFTINNPRRLYREYRQKLQIKWAQQGSAILNAEMISQVPDKDIDFLNAYLGVVIDKGLEDKTQYLVNTIQFIDMYMMDMTDTLLNYQENIDQFRMDNREIISGSSEVVEKLVALEEQKVQLDLENRYYDYLQDYIQDQREEGIFAPNLLGLDVPPLEGLVQQYMQQQWKDKMDMNEQNELNPLVNRRNAAYVRIEENIFESIKNLKALNEQKTNGLNKQIGFYLQAIDDLYLDFWEYSNMNRMRLLYENLYDQLLTRKTDAYISMASATSDYEIVTKPNYNRVPIAPDIETNYIIGIIFGLGFPVGIILLLDLFNPRIISKEDLSKYTDVPIIGSVGHFKGKGNLVVQDKRKSPVAESFRVIRANLEYMDAQKDASRIILVTSSISGEGKTFTSTNLALTYASFGRKTVLIGADMRRPALSRNFNMQGAKGLSNYLSGQIEVDEVIHPYKDTGLSIIPSGHVPPNPAELLNTQRMQDLVDHLRSHFDVIIFDTPPLGLVSDTIELARYSFTPILIVRQKVSYKKSLQMVTKMYHEGKLKNLGIIVNDVNYRKFDYGAYYGRNYGYGSGYGYGYHDKEKKKDRKLLRRLFKS